MIFGLILKREQSHPGMLLYGEGWDMRTTKREIGAGHYRLAFAKQLLQDHHFTVIRVNARKLL